MKQLWFSCGFNFLVVNNPPQLSTSSIMFPFLNFKNIRCPPSNVSMYLKNESISLLWIISISFDEVFTSHFFKETKLHERTSKELIVLYVVIWHFQKSENHGYISIELDIWFFNNWGCISKSSIFLKLGLCLKIGDLIFENLQLWTLWTALINLARVWCSF